MPKPNSTRIKPSKPSPDFPLTASGNGQWVRRIGGKVYCFGRWDDPTGALARHAKEYPYLKEGITPPETLGGWTVARLLNEFLAQYDDRRDAGEITDRTFESAEHAAKVVLKSIPRQKLVESLNPADFKKLRTAIAKKYAPSAANTLITRIRSFFKFADDNRYIDRPVFYGQSFKQLPKRIVRKHRNSKPKMIFTPEQTRILIDSANSARGMRAILLLAFNTGVNNSDVKAIEFRHIDLEAGWMDFPREKTGIERRAKLIPETVEAIREYLEHRKTPEEGFEDNIFITSRGKAWAHSSLATEVSKLRKRVNAAAGEDLIPHGSFGYFRHMLETFGSTEKIVADFVMGHVTEGIGSHYRELIPDSKLIEVADNMRAYLNGGAE